MSAAPRLGGALLALVSLLVGARTAQVNVTYILHIDHPDQHLFRVQMIVPMPEQDIVVALPAWNALYQIRDFSYRVHDIHAFLIARNRREIAVRIAFRNQKAQGHVLIFERIKSDFANSAQQLGKGRIVAEIGVQKQHVDEVADDIFGLDARTASDRRTNADEALLPAIVMQHGLEDR